MEIERLLEQMETVLADARPVPLSASVMVNRKDIDDILADVREALPEEVRQARWILKERDQVLANAHAEAQRITEDAGIEAARRVSETEVVRAARREAERVISEAQEEARVLRLEAEDYVDSKLANFELVLHKTLSAVEKGRERLRGRLAADELAPDELDSSAARAGSLYDHEA